MKLPKLLYPGLKIKRWGFLCLAGILIVIAGSWAYWWDFLFKFTPGWQIRIPIIILGSLIIAFGVREMVRSVAGVFIPQREKELFDIIYTKRHLSKGPRIVAIGGGTGLPVLLSGLKEYTSNITAVVTVSDDGGSSGRLRKEYGILPPGDIRNCLVALADTESLMQDLFQFRFEKGSQLGEHSFGNIFITAMTKITGDFGAAIKESSKVLAVRGRVIPSTLDRATLVAHHIDGSKTVGEDNLTENSIPIKEVQILPSDCQPAPDVLEALLQADAIVFGPGSLYSSILPNLLINSIVDTICQSLALKIYVCNVMTEYRETAHYTASEHIKAIIKHTNPDIIQTVIVNTAHIPNIILERYKSERAEMVIPDIENIRKMGYRVIEEEVINISPYSDIPSLGSIRHNPDKIARIIISLIKKDKKLKGSYI
ncbi:hypothetical protein B9J78_05380 [bacterium Unc6]|nr:hypothetical protein [bacterium Unc6]